MQLSERTAVLKALASDLEASRIGCGTESLVNTALLVTLLEAVQQLPRTTEYDTAALFSQVRDANEIG